ncbi:MAG: methyltransferase domain-containing protein [Burkholderiaceae bacterium]
MITEPRLYSLVGSLLDPLGIAVVRRKTLDRLVRELSALKSSATAENAQDPSMAPRAKAQEAAADLASAPGEFWKTIIRHQIASKWSAIDHIARMFGASQGERACPICNHIATQSAFRELNSHCIFGGGVLLRHQCPDCSLVFGPDKMLNMTPQELTQDYEWHYQVYEEGDSTPQEMRAFAALNPSREGVYLNYGAGGWSRSVQMLRSEGWQVYAYEPHLSAAADLTTGTISDKKVLDGMQFDGIYSNNVLEHLRHPVGELRYLAERLKTGGNMAHVTPCFEYLYEYTRFHLFFFLGRSRNELVSHAGLVEKDFIEDGEFKCGVWQKRDQ